MEKPTSLTAFSPPKDLLSPLISRKDSAISALFSFFPQLPARHLPHIRLREFSPEFDNLGDLVVGKRFLAEIHDLLLGDLAPGLALQDDIRLDQLTHLGIRHADHTGGLDLGMTIENLFHVPGKYRVALVLDQIPLAIKEGEVSFVIHPHQVAGPQPCLAFELYEGLLVLLGSLPVALHDVGAAEDQFTILAHRYEFRSFRFNNRGIYIGDRHTKGAVLWSIIRVAVTDCRGLGQAISLQDLGLCSVLPGAHGGLVKGIGAAADQFEPLPIHAVRLLILLEILKEGGHTIENRRAVALYGIKDIVDIRGGKEDKGVALNQRIEHNHHLPVDVEEGQGRNGHFLALLEYRPESHQLMP